jgi:hypothetical protein
MYPCLVLVLGADRGSTSTKHQAPRTWHPLPLSVILRNPAHF